MMKSYPVFIAKGKAKDGNPSHMEVTFVADGFDDAVSKATTHFQEMAAECDSNCKHKCKHIELLSMTRAVDEDGRSLYISF